MRHLVTENEGHLVPVPVAQLHKWSRDEDETARERKGGKPIRLDTGHLEAMKSIPDNRDELAPNLVEQLLGGLIGVARGLVENDLGHVATDTLFRLNSVGLASGGRLPNPFALRS